jgi:DNA helicase HerA-like ATPase
MFMENITAQDLKRSGVTLKQYVLGRRDKNAHTGILKIGRYLALDKSLGADVCIDALRPHAILICGKRGYGKSYTMGTMIEELSSLSPEVKMNIASLVIDTMGVFWTMRHGNEKEAILLARWGLPSHGFDLDVLVPAGNVKQYDDQHINVKPFSISASGLSGYDWCSLFGVAPVSPLGVLLIKTIDELKEKKSDYSLSDILVATIEDADTTILHAAQNYFCAARSWGIFDEKEFSIAGILKGGKVVILDLSSLENHNIRAITVKILGKKIYEERIKARRAYERKEMGDISAEKGMPMVWMFIDEAHTFLPRESETPATSVLVNEWLRQGRQPGLSVVFATQRPSALHSDVMSQSDMIICHRLTAQDDIAALEAIHPTYMREGISDQLKKMGTDKGVALIIDDISEASHLVKMRPRKSWHGGEEPSALGDKLKSG